MTLSKCVNLSELRLLSCKEMMVAPLQVTAQSGEFDPYEAVVSLPQGTLGNVWGYFWCQTWGEGGDG